MTQPLLEVTKRNILREGHFRMQSWGEDAELLKGAACDSAACIAGHIVAAAVELGLYPEEFEYIVCIYGRAVVHIADAAYYAWKEVYGEDEAMRLDFVAWDDFPHRCITAEMAVRHLEGESPAKIIEETRNASPSTTDWAVREYWSDRAKREEANAKGTAL